MTCEDVELERDRNTLEHEHEKQASVEEEEGDPLGLLDESPEEGLTPHIDDDNLSLLEDKRIYSKE